MRWDLAIAHANESSTSHVSEVVIMRPSLKDLIAKADELAERFEDYEPRDEDLGAPLPPLMTVRLAQFRRTQAEKELAEAIHAARDAKISWRELGEAIGTTGEAVRQRYAS